MFLFQPPGGGGKTQNNHYYVGLTPKDPMGWLSAGSVTEWNSRICLHFSPLVGRQPALIWNEPEIASVLRGGELEYDSNGGQLTPNPKAIAQEPGDLSQNRYSMLLPVLQDKSVTSGGVNKKAYKVGFLAGGQQQSAPVPPPSIGPAAYLELVFVMDATNSMGPYIEGAKNVVREVANRMRGARETPVKIGLMAYRDFIQEQNRMEYITKKFHDLTIKFDDVLGAMNQIQPANTGSEDYPEAAFDGIYAAATETKWNKSKSSLRVIIWIGDASAHVPGADKNPLNYSIPQIREICSKNRIRVVGIKITSELSDDNEIHRRQMQDLIQGKTTADRGHYAEVDLNEANPNQQQQEYIRKLGAEIEEEINNMNVLTSAAKQASGNPANNTALNNVSPTTRAIILKNLKSTAGQANPKRFNEGWIREVADNGQAYVTPYVYMSKDDLALALSYLKISLEGLADPKQQTLNTIRQVLTSSTGDKIDANEKLADHYNKRFGLPAQTNVLKFTLEEIENMGDARIKRLSDQIKSKYNLLVEHESNSKNWFKMPGTQFRYTFVPLTHMP